MMFILRIFLIFAAIFYLLKLFGGRAIGPAKTGNRGAARDRDRGERDAHFDYSEITDQKVEDADYEEL